MDAVTRALADPIRREILLLLRAQPLSAGTIADAFTVSRPAISRHLRVLREAGLVRARVDGREREYSLTLGPLIMLEDYLAELRGPGRWERRLMALETEVHRVKRGRRRRMPGDTHRNHDDQEESA